MAKARKSEGSRAKRVAAPAAPAKILLMYREVGASHVFTAAGFPGFYIASAELSGAFNVLSRALGEHVSRFSSRQVEYDLGVTLEQFMASLRGGNAAAFQNRVIEARRDGMGVAKQRAKELEPA